MDISVSIAALSLIISIISLIISKRISTKALNVQYATIESVIAESISTAAKNMREAGLILIRTNKSDPSYDVVELNFKALKEDYLNAYDHACMRYIDNKIDRVRFRKSYEDDLDVIFNSTEFAEFIKTFQTTKYQALHTVQNVFCKKESL